LCRAHIYTLAGMAGVNHATGSAFDYGVDGQFVPVVLRGNRRVESGHPIAFQAKASTNWKKEDGHIVHDLEAKNYDDIVTHHPSEMMMILVLLCMPAEQETRHLVASAGTMLRNCCYWMTLCGEPCGNTSTKRIRIPVENVLTPDSLKQLLKWEKERKDPQWL
jgi:hypothetical protein